jgi:hypothetical protein
MKETPIVKCGSSFCVERCGVNGRESVFERDVLTERYIAIIFSLSFPLVCALSSFRLPSAETHRELNDGLHLSQQLSMD